MSGAHQVRIRCASRMHVSGAHMTPVYYSVIRSGAHLTTHAICLHQVRKPGRREATHTARSAERRCAAFAVIPASRGCGG